MVVGDTRAGLFDIGVASFEEVFDDVQVSIATGHEHGRGSVGARRHQQCHFIFRPVI